MILAQKGDAACLPYPANYFDGLFTDPPYGYGFMGKDWDKVVVGVATWKEVLRVMKPGAFGFIMSAPRQDVLARMIVNLQEAGFETGFTSIYWTYATGFPKAANISKAVDKKLGVEREDLGESPNWRESKRDREQFGSMEVRGENAGRLTAPASPLAKSLDGAYAGFQPKPAVEVILVVMKPLTEKGYLDQAMKDGKGVTWLEAGRIPYSSKADVQEVEGKKQHEDWGSGPRTGQVYGEYKDARENYVAAQGRFPANLLVSDDVLDDGEIRKCPVTKGVTRSGAAFFSEAKIGIKTGTPDQGTFSRYFDLDAWWEALPESVRQTFPFLIVPKASKAEKNLGCEAMPLHEARYGKNFSSSDKGSISGSKLPNRNAHPTVKPVKLMSYLIAIGSRPGDIILDPFMGSGTTLVAAKIMGRRAVGVDNDPECIPVAEARVKSVQTGLF